MTKLARLTATLAVLLGFLAVVPVAIAADKKDCAQIADPAEREKCEQQQKSQ